MKNVEMKVDEQGILTIKIDTKTRLGESKSGKTIMLASTEGNQRVNGSEVFIGLNCYVYPDKKGNKAEEQ